MFMNNSTKVKSYVTSVITQKIPNYYNNANSSVVGKMKDVTFGVPLEGFVGLKSNIYTFITKDNHDSKIAKSH